MPRKLKVYGWQALRASERAQVRCVVATTSQRAAAVAFGFRSPRQLLSFAETGNREEVEAAMKQPGVVIWRPTTCPTGTFFHRWSDGLVFPWRPSR